MSYQKKGHQKGRRPSNHHTTFKMYYLYKYKYVYDKSRLINTFKKMLKMFSAEDLLPSISSTFYAFAQLFPSYVLAKTAS
jgi:hypothetical protein